MYCLNRTFENLIVKLLVLTKENGHMLASKLRINTYNQLITFPCIHTGQIVCVLCSEKLKFDSDLFPSRKFSVRTTVRKHTTVAIKSPDVNGDGE